MEAQSDTVRRLLTHRCGPAVSHPSIRRPREPTAVDQFTQGNPTRRSECVRHHRSHTGGIDERHPAQVQAQIGRPTLDGLR